MNEIWKDVVGYEKFYKVSNIGRVKRKEKIVEYDCGRVEFKSEKEISITIDKRGYKTVTLFGGEKKKYSVHVLVAKSFCNGFKKGLQVNHIDEDKGNNLFNNLEWVSCKENCNHGERNEKISKKQKGKLNHYYKYIEHYETKPILRGHFKEILIRKGLEFNDFEEIFHSFTTGRKINRKRYVYKRRK